MMKSAIWTKNYEIQLRETPEPELADGEAIVKVSGCGVCGTDVHIYSGEVPMASPPVVLGHEIAGEIAKTGPGSADLKEGDFVCVDPVVGCGKCLHCQEGQTNLCAKPTIIGYLRNGGFEQYVSAPRSHIYPLARSAGAKGGILVETLACVLNGYDRIQIRAGSRVLILGAGCVGLLWTQLVKNSVTTRLFQSEPVKMRRETASDLGADITIDPNREDLATIVRAASPQGVDYIIDATGSAKAIEQAMPLLRKGGTLMIFGVCPQEERITVSPFEMFNNEWKIIAAKMPPMRMPRAVEIIESGIIDFDRLVSHVMPLSDIQKGFDWFSKSKEKAIKIMIDPWG